MKNFPAVCLACLGMLAAATLAAQTTPPQSPPRPQTVAPRSLPPSVTYFYDCAGHDGQFYLGTDKGLFRSAADGNEIHPWGGLDGLNVSTVKIANGHILVLQSTGNLPPETAVASLADGQFKTISPPWNIEEDGIDLRAVHDRFFAVNESGAFTSRDGQTWTAHPQLANGHLAFADGFWYGFEFHQGGESSWLLRSADLQKWDRLTALPSGEIFHSFAVDRGIALLGCNDSRILRIDLKNPAQPEIITFPRPNTYAAISSAGGFFWLQAHQLHASADGKTWTALETLNAALSPPRKPGAPPAGLRNFFRADSSAVLASADTPSRILPISFADLAALARGTLTLQPDPTPPLVQGRYVGKLVPGTRKIIQSQDRFFALTAEGKLYAATAGRPWNWITLNGKLSQPGVQLVDIATDGADSLQLAIQETHEETRDGRQVFVSYHRIERYSAASGFDRRTSAFFPGAQPPAQLAFLDGRFFAILADGALHTADAKGNWSKISLPADVPQGVRGIARLGSRFILPLRNLPGTLLTEDLQSWKKIPVSLGNPAEKTFPAATAGSHLFISSADKIFSSADAENWIEISGFDLPENSRFLGAAHDGNRHWLAFDSALFVSTDNSARDWRQTSAAPHSFFPLPHGLVAQSDTGLTPFFSAPELLKSATPLALSISPASPGVSEGKTRVATTDGAFKKLAKEIDSGALEKQAALRAELEKLPPSGEFNKTSAEEIFQKHFSLGAPTPLQTAAPKNAIRLAATKTDFPFLVHALEVNGTLAACGENGFLAEWDGSAWQSVRTVSAETFVRLASDGKRFFAVGNRGSLVAWTPGQPDRADTRVFPDTAFTGLAHGAGRFVATGSFAGVLTSADGTRWELRPYQKQSEYSATITQAPVVFGAGKFFVPDTSPLPSLFGFVSEDGLTWREVHLAGNFRNFRPNSFGKFSFGFNSWSPVAFAAGDRLFLTGNIRDGKDVPTVLTSTDGIHWEPVKGRLGKMPFTFSGAAFHQGRYLSLPASDGQHIALSSDGLTWDIKALRPAATDDQSALANAILGSPMSYNNFAPCHLLARSNGTWVATGKTGLAFSAKGDTWENNAFDVPMAPPGGTIPGRWIVGASRALRVSPHLQDGVLDSGTKLRPFKGLPENASLHAAATDGKIWVGFSSVPTQSKSQDLGGGISLETKEKPSGDSLRAWFSPDGETWTAAPCPPDAKGYKTRIHAITHTGTAFIAVGSNAAILRSTDGKNWSRESLGEDLRAFASMTENTLPAGKPTRSAWRVAGENDAEKTVRSIYSLEMVAARAGIILAASPKEIFLSADDGQTWRWAGWQAGHLHDLATARDAFWLVGSTFDNGTSALYRSTDGVNWQSVLVTPRDKNPVTQKNPAFLSIFADDSQFAVTTFDSILTSPDGENWTQHYVADQPITQLVRHDNTWLAEIDSRLVWLHSAEKIPPPAALPVQVAAAASANAPIRVANPEALYQEGLAYEQGQLGKDTDDRILRASIAYRQAADAGNVPAMMGLARVHFATLQHRPQLTAEARAEYEKEIIELVGQAAEKNNPEAIRMRAEWYLNGQAGLAKDAAKGIAELQRAAEMGDWPAMRLLGGIHFQGQHVPRNLKLAEFWLEKARTAGDPQAAQLLQSIRQSK